MNGLREAELMLMIDRPRVRKSLIAEEGGWYNGQRDDPGGGRTIGVGHHMKTKVTQRGYQLAMNHQTITVDRHFYRQILNRSLTQL